MPQVFVSYAHSSEEHKEQVHQFAAALRDAGLTVVIDSDVKSPAGPKEQWPRWMTNQIAAADWILLYVDETYRRRFDGDGESGTGLGVKWEGCIVTHDLYRTGGSNNRFIPVLADGTDPSVIPGAIYGATRYFIPSQQDELATGILKYMPEPEKPPSVGDDSNASDNQQAAPSMDEWRQATVDRFADAFLAMRSEDRKTTVAETVGFASGVDKDGLCRFLDQFIRKYSHPDSFDVKSISFIVAKFDALRTDAAGHVEDLAVLTELQDLLLPLCIHPNIKAEVARQMAQHGGAIINEAVALAIGAELATAPADGRPARFRLDDSGKIAGEGLLRFVDAAVGDPNPEQLVSEILHELAEQLSVGLDEEIEDEPDVRKRVNAWTDQLKLQVAAHRIRKKQRFYCVVKPSKNAARRKTLVDLLTRVRLEIPEILFFELYRRSPTKAAEEVVMQVLKDRFPGGGQH